MPVYLFTWHSYRSWMPDRPEGYVVKREGLKPQNLAVADAYHEAAKENAAEFDSAVQRTLIETLLACREPIAIRLHAAATEPTHLHALVSWTTDRKWKSIAASLKRSLGMALVSAHGDQRWFSAGRSRKRVREETHFEHLLRTYLPNHRGWYWSEREGWREPP